MSFRLVFLLEDGAALTSQVYMWVGDKQPGAGDPLTLNGLKNGTLYVLAVAVTRQCDGCITVHTDAALKHGATKEDIAEALGVAIAVNAGAALVYSTRVMDAM